MKEIKAIEQDIQDKKEQLNELLQQVPETTGKQLDNIKKNIIRVQGKIKAAENEKLKAIKKYLRQYSGNKQDKFKNEINELIQSGKQLM